MRKNTNECTNECSRANAKEYERMHERMLYPPRVVTTRWHQRSSARSRAHSGLRGIVHVREAGSKRIRSRKSRRELSLLSSNLESCECSKCNPFHEMPLRIAGCTIPCASPPARPTPGANAAIQRTLRVGRFHQNYSSGFAWIP